MRVLLEQGYWNTTTAQHENPVLSLVTILVTYSVRRFFARYEHAKCARIC